MKDNVIYRKILKQNPCKLSKEIFTKKKFNQGKIKVNDFSRAIKSFSRKLGSSLC